MTSIWEVPPNWFVQNCMAPFQYAERRPGEGAALAYSFSSGAAGGKGKIGGRPNKEFTTETVRQ